MEWTQILVSAVVVLFLLYKLATRNSNYYKKMGIKGTNPLPFIGDSAPAIFRLVDPVKFNIDLYNRFKGCRFFSIQMFSQPTLLIRDPELLKQIMVKDADHFINRFNWFSSTSDDVLTKNLSLLQDEQWRKLRMVMTTIFTAAKMKDMFKFMQVCSEQAAKNMMLKVEEQMKTKGPGSNVLELEIKDYFTRYGTDVIASTAFGLEVDSFKNPNNEFFQVGMALRKQFTSFPVFKVIFMSYLPLLAKALNITFFDKKIYDFFLSTVSETIRNREKYNIVRKDAIHVLTEARKSKGSNENGDLSKAKLEGFTDADITAQAMSFFFGGFDIMSTALSFICYELAANPDIQEKLYEDIEQVIEKEGEITYDGVVHQMQYLDMVIKEGLRKWPPGPMTDRVVSKKYTIPKSDEYPEITLVRGDVMFIPILALHRDPQYYPEPEKFDPERFRDEKNTINPFTYLPFGAGLRHCIALRYAMMEIKVALVYLVRQFHIVPTEKTDIPIQLSKNNSFTFVPKNGFWMGLKPRN